jgi:hypothetical protein
MLVPRKRTALDGKIWWCVFDTISNSFSHIIIFGKYKTKKACDEAITRYLLLRNL